MIVKTHISTCPNDTFMFDALLHGPMERQGLIFEPYLADIEVLNDLAVRGIPDLTKCSYAVVPELLEQYQILTSGSALGRGNGPLLVSRERFDPQQLSTVTVAIPGEKTTANLLLGKLFPQITRKRTMLFSEIIPALTSGAVDAGVLIHEGRFIYRQHGLHLIADLGREWEGRFGVPLPLGAIAVRRSLPEALKIKIDRLLSQSIRFAFENPEHSRPFVHRYAQEMDESVVRQHIGLFVNEFSIGLGAPGKEAVRLLLGERVADCALFVEEPRRPAL
ncbi:MAG: 1,4-dihydroxy-6-naphthoate synthase [Rikenellaceae bacterium]|nr:1,4-dihydroxy-6-naphthoate synthase [Rikenellaceae bacterium]